MSTGLLERMRRSEIEAVPAQVTFDFATPEQFETKATEVLLGWIPELAGKSFHVRMHRRGFKGRLVRPMVERALDEALLEALVKAGKPGRIDFDDPDAIIAIETVDKRAGLALFGRDDLRRHGLLKLD